MTNSALLIGVNEYESGNNLRGCLNDVDNVYSVLIDILKKFKPNNIVVLKDKEATKEAIISHSQELVKKLEPGDYGFFSFSGHGSQVADEDGDEADFKDELICPHDMSWAKKTYITDDELGEIFSKVSDGAWLEVLLDSCHSGTATRGVWGINQEIDKTLESPHADRDLPVKKMVRAVRDVGNHVLWSGCQDSQYSSDAFIGGSYNGAFTYYWSRALREGSKTLRRKILSRIRMDLLYNGFTQTPDLTVQFKGE